MYLDKPSLDELIHYGTPEHSGRYPYGSGEDPYQRATGFMSEYHEKVKSGMSQKDIANDFGISINRLRTRISMSNDVVKSDKINQLKRLDEKGYSNIEIGKRMGINESVVRSLREQAKKERYNIAKNTAEILKRNVDEKKFIDVGTGVERELGVKPTKMATALDILKEEGYEVHSVKVKQVTNPARITTIKVLALPGTSWQDAQKNIRNVQSINDYSPDGGTTFNGGFKYPESISSKRIKVIYGEEGGVQKDGVIELRRGVEDISLGKSSYAQVRIAVDGTHYMKGMAMYSDDIPKGYDIIYNTNKDKGTPFDKVFKPMGTDPDNPFGATIKAFGQDEYIGVDGKKHLRVINKLKEEGDWETYSRNLSSQMLSKQKIDLIRKQLNLASADKESEFDEILSCNNAAVKKKLLQAFADDCDTSAVELKAAALPRQSSRVLLPVPSLKDNEAYAPTYKDGEHVVLIRYPHGGTFEIPELIINNRHAKARRIVGPNAADAIGINLKVAGKLSGADFDGDHVVVIPVNSRIKITTLNTDKNPALASLRNLSSFDPKMAYPGYAGMKIMTSHQKGVEMGRVSNLITDMTLRGAEPDELARAVRHSMVVIDAEKHGLNWRQSEKDNAISSLKERYQGKKNAGASTLISKSSSEKRVPLRKLYTYDKKHIDPNTGEKIYDLVDEDKTVYTDKSGKERLATTASTRMAEVNDAFKLSSGTVQENAYAIYANKMKSLGNQARKEFLVTENTKTNSSAKEAYANEVSSLNAKLNTALKNSPKERRAQLLANIEIRQKKFDNPNMEKEEEKKLRQQALARARVQVGANKGSVQVDISTKEWEAIQAGAISHSKLTSILNNTDLDKVKSLAMPKTSTELSPAKIRSILAMRDSKFTIDEIAKQLGISTSSVSHYTHPK